jgi:hypothetical protein
MPRLMSVLFQELCLTYLDFSRNRLGLASNEKKWPAKGIQYGNKGTFCKVCPSVALDMYELPLLARVQQTANAINISRTKTIVP